MQQLRKEVNYRAEQKTEYSTLKLSNTFNPTTGSSRIIVIFQHEEPNVLPSELMREGTPQVALQGGGGRCVVDADYVD